MKKYIAASDNFSVALGLFDYINPMFYAVTCLTVALHTWNVMPLWVYLCYVAGAVVSMVFGLTIPTVKLLVGLGKMRFKMPVNLVFYVNSGILVSCLSLFGTLMRPGWWLFCLIAAGILGILVFVYLKKRRFNTVAVLTGALGYVLFYITMITYAVRQSLTVPVVFYGLAVTLLLLLSGIGIKANLKDARVHWVIEACNVTCQGCVALGTLFAFGVL